MKNATYQELKQIKQDSYNSAVDECQIFFAFSNNQFAEGIKKINLQDGEKVVSIGAGGYCKKSNVDKFISLLKKADNEYKKNLKAIKDELKKTKAILYELNNYECFYTGDISNVVDLFTGIYTQEEIEKVFKSNRDY